MVRLAAETALVATAGPERSLDPLGPHCEGLNMRHHRVHVRAFPFTRSTAPHLLIASLVPASGCAHVRVWVCAGFSRNLCRTRRRYFLLNAEDYRWQWISFLSSASTALYAALPPGSSAFGSRRVRKLCRRSLARQAAEL